MPLNGTTKKFLEDPIGSILLLAVIVVTALRETGVIPEPFDRVAGIIVAGLYSHAIIKRTPDKQKGTAVPFQKD